MSDRLSGSKIYVSTQTSILQPVDANINDDTSLFELRSVNKPSSTDSDNNNICHGQMLVEVSCSRVANGHRTIALLKQLSNRSTHDIGAAYYHRMLP